MQTWQAPVITFTNDIIYVLLECLLGLVIQACTVLLADLAVCFKKSFLSYHDNMKYRQQKHEKKQQADKLEFFLAWDAKHTIYHPGTAATYSNNDKKAYLEMVRDLSVRCKSNSL